MLNHTLPIPKGSWEWQLSFRALPFPPGPRPRSLPGLALSSQALGIRD